MKSGASKIKRILSALLSGTMILGAMAVTATSVMPGNMMSLSVHAKEDDEGEGPIIPPDGTTVTSNPPDMTLIYPDVVDETMQIPYGSDPYEMPFIPSPNRTSYFSNGLKWQYYSKMEPHINFSKSNSVDAVPSTAITELGYNYFQKSKALYFSGIVTVEDGAFDLSKVNGASSPVVSALSLGTVESIGSRAFAGLTTIQNLQLTATVRTIGSEAFKDVDTSVTFSVAGAIAFGKDAFASLSSSQSVVLPYGSTFVNGDTTVPIVPENGKYPDVFGDANVTVRDEYTLIPRVEPTCTAKGNIAYYVDPSGNYFVLEGGQYVQIEKKDIVLAATGHDLEFDHFKWVAVYEETADGAYPEEPDYLNCYKAEHCSKCDKDIETKVTLRSKTAAATRTAPKKTVYWYDYTDANNEQKREIHQLVKGEALGHDFGQPTYEWSYDNGFCTAARVCSRDASHVETEKAASTKTFNESTQQYDYSVEFSNGAFEPQTTSGTPSFVLDDGVFEVIDTITFNNAPFELSADPVAAIPLSSGNYWIYASSPLEFSVDPSDTDLTDLSSVGYNLKPDGTQYILVSLKKLPSVTFEQQLQTNGKITRFMKDKTAVASEQYEHLPLGHYFIESTVPLAFTNQSENGEDVEVSEPYYINSLYGYYFTVAPDTGDFAVVESTAANIEFVSLSVTDGAKAYLTSIAMMTPADPVVVYSQNDESVPETLQAGRSYKITASANLYITGAAIDETAENDDDSITYTVTVSEESEGLVIDRKDVAASAVTFYNAENEEINISELTYTGSDLTPASVTVYDGDYCLEASQDYEIGYSGDWTEITRTDGETSQQPTVTITGSGIYTGTTLTLTGCIYGKLVNTSAAVSNEVCLGNDIVVNASATGGKGDYTYAFYFKRADETAWRVRQEYEANTQLTITPGRAADYHIVVKAKDALGTVARKSMTVHVYDRLANTSTVESESVCLGNNIVVNASATGGRGDYTYAFYFKRSDETAWRVRQEYEPNAQLIITPGQAADYDIVVKVKDADGTIARKSLTVHTFAKLVNTSEADSEEVPFGSEIVVNASAAGGLGDYTYSFYFRRSDETVWRVRQEYTANSQLVINPAFAAEYVIIVKVKDSRGVVARKTLRVEVKKPTNTSVVPEEIDLGESIEVNCSAEGGFGEYQYAVYFKQESDDKWTAAQSYSDNTVVVLTPSEAGTYDVVVKAKDKNGAVDRVAYKVKVNDFS